MFLNERISKSIKLYTDSDNCAQTIKILMNPTNYLLGLKNSGHYNILNEFIKTESRFNIFINYIKDMMIQCFKNYENNSNIDSTIYRAISKVELDYLKTGPTINEFYSATKKYEDCAGYLIETANSEWEPVEHFIVELTHKNNIPYIDVDNDSSNRFEPNEVILLPRINISNLHLIKEGYPSCMMFYSASNIPIYGADIISDDNYEDVTEEMLIAKYNEVAPYIDIFGKMVESYLQSMIGNELFNNLNYLKLVNRLNEYMSMLKSYVKKCVKKNNLDIKIPRLKK